MSTKLHPFLNHLLPAKELFRNCFLIARRSSPNNALPTNREVISYQFLSYSVNYLEIRPSIERGFETGGILDDAVYAFVIESQDQVIGRLELEIVRFKPITPCRPQYPHTKPAAWVGTIGNSKCSNSSVMVLQGELDFLLNL